MTKTEIVRAAVRNYPDSPSKTIATAIYAEHPQLFPNLNAVCCAVRYARGAQGNKHRKHPVFAARPLQPAGFKWVFPRSYAETWKPFPLESEKALVISDIHIPFHDPRAIAAVMGYARPRKPDCILINGDLCDFFSISRFDKSPTKSALKREIDLTRAFLGWLRQEFPGARIVYKYGNHDEWFEKYLWRKAPELFQLPQVKLENILTQATPTTPALEGIEFVTDQRKITAGHLDILHGHELGKGSIAPPVNPARGFFLKTLECTLAGHLHRESQHSERTSKGKNIACWSTGCLCGLWPDYAKVNKWSHSAAWVEVSGRSFNVTPLRVIDGQVV